MELSYPRQKLSYAGALIVRFALGVMPPVLLFCFGRIVDAAAGGVLAADLLLILLALYGLQNILDVAAELLKEKQLREIERSSAEALIGLLRKISAEKFDLVPSASNSAHILDKFGARYRTEYFQSISDIASAIPSALGYLWIISRMGIGYSLAAVLMALVFALLFSFFSKNESRAWDEAMPHLRFCRYLSDVLTGRGYYPERKVFSYFGHIQAMWNASIQRFQKIIRKANTGSRLQSGGMKFLSFTATVVLLWLMYDNASESYSGGQFVSAAMALWAFTDVVDASILGMIKAGRQMNQYREHFSGLCSLRTDDARIVLDETFVFESLMVDHVCYAYPGQSIPALDDVSLRIARGDSFALVGANGSGKSTLVKIILGFLTPTSGAVYLNEIDVRSIEPASLYRVMNALLQDSTHFELEVSKQFGPVYDGGKVHRTLDILSGGDNFIAALPDREESVVGEKRSNSVNLSGGEWQRLGAARLLLSDASFLILDEPTANLDAIAEQRLYRMILESTGDRTSLMITHRLGSTRHVGTILVMDGGRIIESGNHDSLIRAQGFYCRMYETQKANYIFEE